MQNTASKISAFLKKRNIIDHLKKIDWSLNYVNGPIIGFISFVPKICIKSTEEKKWCKIVNEEIWSKKIPVADADINVCNNI